MLLLLLTISDIWLLCLMIDGQLARKADPSTNSLEEISFSYNGGKDCLVLLILLLAGLSIHHSLPSSMQNKNKTLPAKLPSVYIISSHPFAEVDEFVNTSSEHYHLSLSRYAMPMKQAFAKYLEENKHVKAILVGTRRTDPHGGLLTHFDMTDGGWPRFMRVHPVIDWHYREIWAVSLTSLFPLVYPYLSTKGLNCCHTILLR